MTAIDNVENCPVCLEPIIDMFKILECTHKVHVTCLLNLIKNVCPICRAEIGLKFCTLCYNFMGLNETCNNCIREKMLDRIITLESNSYNLFCKTTIFASHITDLYRQGLEVLTCNASEGFLNTLNLDVSNFKRYLRTEFYKNR